jgi:hypothetical protein
MSGSGKAQRQRERDTDTPAVFTRLPRRLYEELTSLAVTERRSLSAQCAFMLQESLQEHIRLRHIAAEDEPKQQTTKKGQVT